MTIDVDRKARSWKAKLLEKNLCLQLATFTSNIMRPNWQNSSMLTFMKSKKKEKLIRKIATKDSGKT